MTSALKSESTPSKVFKMIVLAVAEEQNVLDVTLAMTSESEKQSEIARLCEYLVESYLRVNHDHAFFIVFQTTDAATATVCGSHFPGC